VDRAAAQLRFGGDVQRVQDAAHRRAGAVAGHRQVHGTRQLDAQTGIARGFRRIDRADHRTDAAAARGAVEVRASHGQAGQRKTDDQGDFELNVAPGPYQLKISVPGGDFKEVNQAIRVTADMAPLSYTMTIAAATEIEVSSVNNELGIDPDSSLNTDVITGDALLDLPENEDDLLAYLTQLAQLRGGEGEVTLSVDGFTNGTLPPLAQIAEIRIVNSSFSADGSSGPRIEIVTRAGSGKWTAQTQFTFMDESLNALNHLSTGKRPKAQTRNLQVNSSGPLVPGKLSLNASVAHNESESGGADLRAVTPFGAQSGGVTSINGGKNFTLSPRWQINKENNLTTSFNYQSRKVTNSGVGGLTLPERVSNNKNSSWQLQISDRFTRGRVVNTIRFQDQHSSTNTSLQSTPPEPSTQRPKTFAQN